MNKKPALEIAHIARQLREQIEFYRDIGVTDIGGAAQPFKEKTVDATAQGSFRQQALFADLVPEGPGHLPQKPDASLRAIREDIGECTRCKLHQHRTQIVFGEGNPRAEIVFVGEAPGADEDALGRPFVGRAGQLLNRIIEAIGFKREDVYITNIVLCRPPGNRTPERDEIETCKQFLFRQLAFIRPKVIVALGSPAAQCILGIKEPITKIRGQWHEWSGIRVMPTFHPAYLLRSPDKKREAWEDMKRVRDYVRSDSAGDQHQKRV